MALKNAAKVVYYGDTLFDLTKDTVEAGKMLADVTAHGKDGQLVTGTIPTVEDKNFIIQAVADEFTVDAGYHANGGTIAIDYDEQAKIIPTNIRKGETVLGVAGTLEELNAGDAGTVVPRNEEQTVAIPEGHNAISAVKVAKVPYAEETNSDGGLEITIGL